MSDARTDDEIAELFAAANPVRPRPPASDPVVLVPMTTPRPDRSLIESGRDLDPADTARRERWPSVVFVAAAVALVVSLFVTTIRDAHEVVPADQPVPPPTVDVPAESIATTTVPSSDLVDHATAFWEAIAAGDREVARSLVDPAFRDTDAATPFGRAETLEAQFDWYEAVGWQWTLEECAIGDSPPVTCTATASNAWSEALGVEPVTGRFFVLFGDDGIRRISERNDSFGSQWGPNVAEIFFQWVTTYHPDDARLMFDFDRDPNTEAMELYDVNTKRFVESQAPRADTDESSPEVASPLDELRSLLTSQADSELFVVKSNAESSWRLVTLARFDGATWGIPESVLGGAGGELAADREGGEELRQEIRIVDLGGKLVPAAPNPVAVSSGDGLNWSADSAALVKVDGDLVAGDGYEIVSVLPRIEREDLQAATSAAPDNPMYLELPDDVPTVVGTLAREVTAETTTTFEAAIALQSWFQTEFDYSLEVQAGHGNTSMEAFLNNRIGYAEQFAGTYAVMMRVVGIPARVAVGFTQGADAGDQGVSVLGKNAHAWPELWFDGLGWVPFEPTPGSGAPGTQDGASVVAQQSE